MRLRPCNLGSERNTESGSRQERREMMGAVKGGKKEGKENKGIRVRRRRWGRKEGFKNRNCVFVCVCVWSVCICVFANFSMCVCASVCRCCYLCLCK